MPKSNPNFRSCLGILLAFLAGGTVVHFSERWSIPSFYYRLNVTNNMQSNFLEVSLTQLSDVMTRGRSTASITSTIGKAQTAEMRICGECESDQTVFVLSAFASNHSGAPSAIPQNRMGILLLDSATIKKLLTKPIAIGEADLIDITHPWQPGIAADFTESP